MKSKSTINRNLRELRQFIDSTDDKLASRVAYSMEFAVRWATMDTVGWPGLLQFAKDEADLIRQDLGMPAATMTEREKQEA